MLTWASSIHIKHSQKNVSIRAGCVIIHNLLILYFLTTNFFRESQEINLFKKNKITSIFTLGNALGAREFQK
jgi:hypothetical protein